MLGPQDPEEINEFLPEDPYSMGAAGILMVQRYLDPLHDDPGCGVAPYSLTDMGWGTSEATYGHVCGDSFD